MNSTSNTLPATPAAKDDHILWNHSVKLASMLYYWKLVDSYESILRLLHIHQRYLRQEPFKHDNTFLPQLEEQLPKVDGPRTWACYHIGAYALMARALIRRGYGIAILLKDDVFEEQLPIYVELFKKSFRREPKPTELQFVRSSGSTTLVALKRLLLAGFHVICYVYGKLCPHPSGCSHSGRRETDGTEQGRPIRKQPGAIFRRYAINTVTKCWKNSLRRKSCSGNVFPDYSIILFPISNTPLKNPYGCPSTQKRKICCWILSPVNA